MLLLVPYHGMKFLQTSHGGFLGSTFILQWLHLWRMPLFFAVSGFLAAMTLSRWGLARQLRSRIKRIGIPFVVGMVTIVPLVGLVMIGLSHLYHSNRAGGPKPFVLENVLRTQPMHLWFLEYLLVMSLLTAAIVVFVQRSGVGRERIDALFRAVISSPLMIPALALASGFALYMGGYWRASGIVAHSLVPDFWMFAYYTVFFLFGWLLYRNISLLPRVESRPAIYLACGTVFAIAAYYFYTGRSGVTDPETRRIIVLVNASLATWLTLFGFWSLFARIFARERRWLRYLADSAYWIFLIHVPFLTFASISLAQTGIPAVPRLLIAVTFSISASLGTYALFVRHTAIGRLLHGPRPRGKATTKSPAATPSIPSAEATSLLPPDPFPPGEPFPTGEIELGPDHGPLSNPPTDEIPILR